jgi:hypothetical protein
MADALPPIDQVTLAAAVNVVRVALRTMTDEGRLELMDAVSGDYCRECGGSIVANGRRVACYCTADE